MTVGYMIFEKIRGEYFPMRRGRKGEPPLVPAHCMCVSNFNPQVFTYEDAERHSLQMEMYEQKSGEEQPGDRFIIPIKK